MLAEPTPAGPLHGGIDKTARTPDNREGRTAGAIGRSDRR